MNDDHGGATLLRIATLLGIGVLAGCVAAERIPDKPMPAPRLETVDYGPLFGKGVHSHTALAAPVEKGLLQRVLLGPNLVFESSRTSLPDAPIGGPPAATAQSPRATHTLGHAVSIPVSSAVIRFLMHHGSVPLVPAVMRRWLAEGWCKKDCTAMTWVERLLLLGRRGAEGVPPEQLPTSILSVRRFDAGDTEVDGYAVRDPESKVVQVKLRPGPRDTVLCSLLGIRMPTVWLQAELLSLRDGRIVARIDERVTPQVLASTVSEVPAWTWKAVKARGGNSFQSYEYVASWDAEHVFCANVRTGLGAILARAPEARSPSGLVLDLLERTLGRLYEAPTVAPR